MGGVRGEGAAEYLLPVRADCMRVGGGGVGVNGFSRTPKLLPPYADSLRPEGNPEGLCLLLELGACLLL